MLDKAQMTQTLKSANKYYENITSQSKCQQISALKCPRNFSFNHPNKQQFWNQSSNKIWFWFGNNLSSEGQGNPMMDPGSDKKKQFVFKR